MYGVIYTANTLQTNYKRRTTLILDRKPQILILAWSLTVKYWKSKYYKRSRIQAQEW